MCSSDLRCQDLAHEDGRGRGQVGRRAVVLCDPVAAVPGGVGGLFFIGILPFDFEKLKNQKERGGERQRERISLQEKMPHRNNSDRA